MPDYNFIMDSRLGPEQLRVVNQLGRMAASHGLILYLAGAAARDLILGLGDPLQEIVQLDFQASAAAWKHADLLVYHGLLYAHCQVPVHTVIVLLRPQAAHANLNGVIRYAPRPGRGRMDFGYEIVRLWERAAAELLAGDLGVARGRQHNSDGWVLRSRPESQSAEAAKRTRVE